MMLLKFLTILFTGFLLMAFTSPILGASITRKRAIDEKSPCVNNTPCGWAIYTPFTRKVDYFMKNSCVCPTEQQCIRIDDDISVSAYVYRCRESKSGSSSNTQTDSS